MAQYIDKSALVAEIIRRRKAIPKEEDDKRLKAVYGNEAFVLTELLEYINTLEVKEVVDLEKSIDVDSMVTEYLKQYEEAGQTPFAMNIIGSAYRKGLEDMFRVKAQKGEEV